MPRRERDSRGSPGIPAERIWSIIVAICAAFVVLVFKVSGCRYDEARRSEQRWHQVHPYGAPADEKPKFTPSDLDAYYRKGTSR